ncbi:hypothetical protein ACN42_g9213 [Penicillium freii]|uniref:Uncharacterized protein n=1 Tax=Penicillium freii TaxID=48697 RepID=A0A101MCD0_PENFR|nr:hypothetical protein ACN42_g9213 [Penicillium freii]
MQNEIRHFASVFAPQAEDNSEIFKYIIDAVVLVASIGSSFAWNIPFKGLAMATSKWFSMGKDVTNAALVSFSTTMDALGTQNGISSALGTCFSAWNGLESGYITSLFSGAKDEVSIDALKTLTANGSMLLLSPKVDLSGMTSQAEKILYGQLIPAAWAISPETLYPRILRKAGAWSTSIDGDVLSYMSKNTLVGGYVCYNNDAFYVVNINTSPGMQSFEALPGGNHQTLNGNDWGGVILEDIVQSSYQAYQLNGNANGYEMSALSKIIDESGTGGDLVFENGIRTPGFFTLPICDDIQAASNIVAGVQRHVNNGCINVNGENICKSQTKYTNIADQSTGDITATIYAQFDGDDKTDYKVTPGCKLEASWPRAYGDVYFGVNNCLYDSTGTNINGQCCTETTTDSVLNPYYGY